MSKVFFIINRVCVSLFFLLAVSAVQGGIPLWTFTPAPGSSPTRTVPENITALVQYVVQNQSSKAKRLVMKPILGIQQTTPCQLAPIGQVGSTCILDLSITGSALPAAGVQGGPELCQANLDGTPNPNQ